MLLLNMNLCLLAGMQIIWPRWIPKDEVFFKEYVHTYIHMYLNLKLEYLHFKDKLIALK